MAIRAEGRGERIDVRTTPLVKRTLQRAAAAANKTVSEFLLDSGLTAAAETLADRRYFLLSSEQWEAFTAALDAPSRERPRLRGLLTEPGVFD
jgi:uncharacterized protein (DUF1778 family)